MASKTTPKSVSMTPECLAWMEQKSDRRIISQSMAVRAAIYSASEHDVFPVLEILRVYEGQEDDGG